MSTEYLGCVDQPDGRCAGPVTYHDHGPVTVARCDYHEQRHGFPAIGRRAVIVGGMLDGVVGTITATRSHVSQDYPVWTVTDDDGRSFGGLSAVNLEPVERDDYPHPATVTAGPGPDYVTGITRPTYRERRAARAERLRNWADKREAKAEAGHERAHEMASAIPFGQPMLTDHHSYGRDRRYRDRISSTTSRAVEDGRKADEMRAKADNIEAAAARAIYSDDPDALPRLHEKLAELEAQRDRIKAFNASCRKGTPNPELLDDRQRADLASVTRHAPYQLGKRGEMPTYALSNLSGTIKRTRDRIAQLEREENDR